MRRQGAAARFLKFVMFVVLAFGSNVESRAQSSPPPGPGALPATCSGLDGYVYPTCSTASSVAAYRCWEKELTSNSTYPNAYQTVKVRVDFRSNGRLRHSTYAFWDGDDDILVSSPNARRFKFRTFFDTSGSWTWTSVCEAGCAGDAGLVGSGAITVTAVPPTETNPFYKNGHVVQTGGNTGTGGIFHCDPIKHIRGARFFWNGDTAWAATLRACHDEWVRYVNDRVTKGFTVVQLALAPTWGGPASIAPFAGPQSRREVTTPASGVVRLAPFRQIGTGSGSLPNSASRWVSEFWRHLDGMVQYANSSGLLVLVAGVAKPVDSYPATTDAVIFARNLAARLAGNHVVLSPGLDDTITGSVAGLLNAVGDEIYFANDNMMTANHYGTRPTSDCAVFQDEVWLRFHLFQSGFNAGNADTIANRARTMPQDLRGFTSISPFTTIQKPVVNGEAIYDYGYGNNTDDAELGKLAFGAGQARKAGYLSWLTGASGYSFGAAGIWEWGMCSMSPPPNVNTCNDGPAGLTPQSTTGNDFRNYYSAMGAPSSSQISTLGNALRGSDWWALIANEQTSANNHIWNNGPFSERLKMVIARDPDVVIGYLPHNDRIKLTTGSKGIDPLNAHFYNPREGFAHALPFQIVEHFLWQHSYYQPAGVTGLLGSDDWVLALFPAAPAAMSWSGDLPSDEVNTIRTWPSTLKAGGTAVFLDVVDSGGEVVASTSIGHSPAPVLPRRIKAARDGRGRFLVTWEERATAIEPPILRLVRTSPLGSEELEPELPEQSDMVERLNPSVAANSNGDFLLVWEERDLSTDSSRILGQRYFEDGWADGSTFELLASVAGRPRRPKAACASSGECWVAWEVRDEESGIVDARAQRFDAGREAVGLDLQINQPGEGDLWLTLLAIDDTGAVELEWESFSAEGRSRGRLRTVRGRAGEVLQPEARQDAPWEAEAE